MVKVMCGINAYPTTKVIGMKVSDIRKNFKDVLNIPADAKSLLNGQPVKDDTIVPDGSELVAPRA
jgi:hypothetical protein